jgi:hypothetical protein
VGSASCAGNASAREASWAPFARIPSVVDVSPPRADGRLTVAVAGRLGLLRVGGALSPFARGSRGYATTTGEAYIALSIGARLPGARCAFARDDVYALDPSARPGVIRIDASGRARRVADLPAGSFPNGIAFDGSGTFGHRLLVTAGVGRGTAALYSLDCRNRRRTVAARIPIVEGGIAVAPRSFGRFGGQLIAPDELSGRLIAIDARGRARTLARSGLPAGGDIGVESVGFAPAGFDRTVALLADRGVPGNPHPGTDTILGVAGAALQRAGVRAGDLLAATEGGAITVAVRCGRRACAVRRVAHGPAVAHAEGHIVFAARARDRR